MLMNKIEFWLMNNPVRALIQKFEARKLRRMSVLKEGSNILEIGCGQGVGTKLIKTYFKPQRIQAIDLDPKMIKRAKRRIKDSHIRFEVGDASKLRFQDDSFDAIFDFGIIHHIPNWRDCLKELFRVLKPGGQLIMEDLSIDTFQTRTGRTLRLFLDHPYDQMYTKEEFFQELKSLGFKIKQQYSNPWWFGVVLTKEKHLI
jgi:ubiquinone/menaquinone biosynthesis C-methylase UbiE